MAFGDTPKLNSESLCIGCRHSTVIVDQNLTTKVHCHMVGKWLHRKIIKCNAFEAKDKPDLHDLKAIAWKLQTDGDKGPLGFQPPKPPLYVERD